MPKEKTKATCPHCGESVEAKPEKKYYCPSCEGFFDEVELTKIYECGSCGETFSREESHDGMSNRCPSCAKWGHIMTENVCPECQEEEELEEVDALVCPSCGETFKLGEKVEPTLVWRVPWKKGQDFLLKGPYTKEIKTYDGSKVLWTMEYGGSEPTYGTIHSIDRKRKLISLDVWGRHTSGWGAHLESFTVEELKENWKAVSRDEWGKWMEQVDACSRCGAKAKWDGSFLRCTGCDMPYGLCRCNGKKVKVGEYG